MRIFYIALVCIIVVTTLISCQRKGTCPAYKNGKVTGTEGSNDKARQLFPKKMRRN